MANFRFHVKKGDEVTVTTGNHKGSTGKILQVFPVKQRVLVEGVRMIKKHTRKSQDNPQGAIIEREGPIHISNVKLVEHKDTKAEAKAEAKGKTAKATKSKKKEKAS